MDDLRKIDVDDPDVDMDDTQRLLYRGELCTGEVVEYLNGVLVSQDMYVPGLPDGLTREKLRQVFDDSGLVLKEGCEWDESGRQTRAWTFTEG